MAPGDPVPDLQSYLHDHIPLTGSMGIEVREAGPRRVILAAPLPPNINHQGSAFGGSVASMATLAAWSLIRLRLGQAAARVNIVVSRSRIDYLTAIRGELEAISEFTDDALWQEAREKLQRRGRTRLEVTSRLEYDGAIAARFSGTFALLAAGRDA